MNEWKILACRQSFAFSKKTWQRLTFITVLRQSYKNRAIGRHKVCNVKKHKMQYQMQENNEDNGRKKTRTAILFRSTLPWQSQNRVCVFSVPVCSVASSLGLCWHQWHTSLQWNHPNSDCQEPGATSAGLHRSLDNRPWHTTVYAGSRPYYRE